MELVFGREKLIAFCKQVQTTLITRIFSFFQNAMFSTGFFLRLVESYYSVAIVNPLPNNVKF